MNDDLRAMVQETANDDNKINEPQITEESIKEENIHIEKEIKDTIIEQPNIIENIIEPEELITIPLVSFNTWFINNVNNFDNISRLGIQTNGINTTTTIVAKTLDVRGGTLSDNTPLQRLIVFENADEIKIFNLPGTTMKIYTNDCTEIIYNKDMIEHENPYVLKSYRMKKRLFGVLNYEINNMLIPIYIEKIKKKENNIILPNDITKPEDIVEKIKQPIDKESLKMLYKQSYKVLDSMNTIEDAIKWLIDRKESVYDVAHLIQIDDVIIQLIS